MNHPDLRPLGTGEILDGVFALYRRNFAAFFLMSIVPLIPLMLAWIGLAFALPSSTEGAAAAATAQLFLTPYSLIAAIVSWGAITDQAARAYGGDAASAREGFAAAFRRFFPLLGATLLGVLLMAVGFVLLVIPGILVLIMLFAVGPVVMLEGRGAVESLRRSRFLAREAWGKIFTVMFVLMVIVSIPSFAIGLAAAFGPLTDSPDDFATGGGTSYALLQVAASLVSGVTTPILPIGLLLLYYDRRVRAEGLDLELATERITTSV